MIDIIRILQIYKIPYDPDQNKGWVNVICPFCHSESGGYYGGFNLFGEYYHCWKCEGHSLNYALQKILNINSGQVKELISEHHDETIIRKKLNKRKAKGIHLELPGDPLSKLEKNYLKKRGFDPNYLVEKYKISSGGISGRWKYRIMIPIFYYGRLVSWTARAVSDKQTLRYKNLSIEESIIDPKTIFYNMDNVEGSNVGLLEGPADVWNMGDNFICGFGTSLVEAQIRELTRFNKVFIVFDSGIHSIKRAFNYAEKLNVIGGIDVEVIDTETKEDPGEFSQEQVEELKRELKL